MGIKFGTDGWRAVMADEFTFANVKLVVQGVAQFLQDHPLKKNGIVVGYDNRFLSEQFAAAAAMVMAGNGIKVWMVNRATPTPVTAFAVITHQSAGALMITASHNPPEYNGIKFIPDYGGPALPLITDRIEEELVKAEADGRVEEISLKKAVAAGLYSEFDPMPPYLERIKELVDLTAIRRADLKLIADPMFGAGIHYLDAILGEAGCQVESLHNYRDPLFGGSLPEPSRAVLGELRQRVLEKGADLGLALDGDADRFGVIDASGDFINSNQVLSLLYYHLLKERKIMGPAARTVATTHMLDRIAKSFGFQIVETPVGFKYIGQSLMQQGCIMGGEESGGLSIKGHIPEKDGILAVLLMAEIRAVHGKTLQEILKSLEAEFGPLFSQRLDIRVDPDDKARIMDLIKTFQPEQIAGIPVQERITVDGLKIVLTDGSWFLIRASGTEPLFRIYAEAGSGKQLRDLQTEVKELNLPDI